MIRKIMLLALPLLFCGSVASHLLYYFDIRAAEALVAYKVCFCTFQIAGVLWIYSLGTLRKSLLRNLIYLSIGIFWIGQTFVITHWPGGRIILFAGAAGVLLCYGIHFLKKRRKMYLDWLKLTGVVLFLSMMTIGLVYGKKVRLWVGWTFNLNAIVLIGLYYFQAFKKEESGHFELSEDEAAVFDYKKP